MNNSNKFFADRLLQIGKRASILHNSVGAAMAAMADGKRTKVQPKGIMTDEEIEALAAIM